MKISVIVPVYNVEQYLPKCLDSLVNQTIDDYEIILINDGSPDNSQKIIDDYKERYPGIIKSVIVENGGQGRARNFGIDMAKGEYIGFADSDDWVDTAMYEKLYNAAKREDADIVTCDAQARSPDGGIEYLYTAQYRDPMCVSGSVWNKLFRRSFVGDIRFPEGLWYEDFEFVLKLMLRSERVAQVHESLYFYRVSPDSTMRNNNARKNLDIITIMEHIRVFMEEKGYCEGFDTVIINHVLFDAVNRVSRQRSPDKEKVIKELRDYVHLHIPKLTESIGFQREIPRRRLVMWLNYHGLEKVSCMLFKIKNALSRISVCR